MNVTLTPELQRFVAEKVRSGEYATPEDVIVGALSVLQTQDQLNTEDIANLRAEVAIGVSQADRGRFVEFRAADVIAEGRRRLADQERAR